MRRVNLFICQLAMLVPAYSVIFQINRVRDMQPGGQANIPRVLIVQPIHAMLRYIDLYVRWNDVPSTEVRRHARRPTGAVFLVHLSSVAIYIKMFT